jgi:hypothetical protein
MAPSMTRSLTEGCALMIRPLFLAWRRSSSIISGGYQELDVGMMVSHLFEAGGTGE